MSHLRRLRTSDRIFFVTVNLRRVVAPLAEGEYALVADALAESRRKLQFLLYGYVLMPDHWHALIWTTYPLTISRVIQDIKWISAVSLNRARNGSGSVWQHQFWDRFVRHGKELRDRLTYMHFNPVRKGLVTKPEEWRWSSCNNFALDKKVVASCPIRIDDAHLPESYRG
ncbi:MAG TPA: transposase [Terriglobia bacterium]|nr:transposase [Terriglobia bacterium]